MIWPILLDGPEHCYGPSKNKTSKRPGRQVVAGPHRHGDTTKHAASNSGCGVGASGFSGQVGGAPRRSQPHGGAAVHGVVGGYRRMRRRYEWILTLWPLISI